MSHTGQGWPRPGAPSASLQGRTQPPVWPLQTWRGLWVVTHTVLPTEVQGRSLEAFSEATSVTVSRLDASQGAGVRPSGRQTPASGGPHSRFLGLSPSGPGGS